MGLLVLGMIAGTVVIYGASLQQHRGYAWADNVCAITSFLCASPSWIGVVTIAFSIVYFYRLSLDT